MQCSRNKGMKLMLRVFCENNVYFRIGAAVGWRSCKVLDFCLWVTT